MASVVYAKYEPVYTAEKGRQEEIRKKLDKRLKKERSNTMKMTINSISNVFSENVSGGDNLRKDDNEGGNDEEKEDEPSFTKENAQ